MNKAFIFLVKYIRRSLEASCAKLSRGIEGPGRYTYLINMMTALEHGSSDTITWKKSKMLEKEHVANKRHTERVLYPGFQQLVSDSLKTWNQSEVFQAKMKSTFEVYEVAAGGEEGSETRLNTPNYREGLQFLMMSVATLNANRNIVSSKILNRHVWSADIVVQDNLTGEVTLGQPSQTRTEIGRSCFPSVSTPTRGIRPKMPSRISRSGSSQSCFHSFQPPLKIISAATPLSSLHCLLTDTSMVTATQNGQIVT